MRKILFPLFTALCAMTVSSQATVIKKLIDGVYYNFDTSSRTVTFVTGQGSGTNRTEFKGKTLHVPATMVLDGVTYTMGNIGNAFQGCQNLEELTFDSPVKFTEISLWAFAECPKLKSVVVPEGVTTLGADRAFGSDRSLEEATLPSTIKTIGGWSFFDDPALKVVHINAPTPPSLGTYAFGGSTSCIITVPDEAYNTYKNNSTWKTFTIMKASEYSVSSGKIALLNYLAANAEAMNAARGGTTPDVYPQDEFDTFAAAKLHADTVSTGDFDEDTYNQAQQDLETAWQTLLQSYNPITTGYYNIQSAYTSFLKNQKEYKGMIDNGSGTLAWGSYHDLDPYQAFYVEALDDGNFRISNFATGQFIIGATTNANGTAVLTGSEPEREQVITPIGHTQWIIADNVYDKAYHPQGHSSGSGKQGNIVLFNANTVGSQSTWKMIPIHPNVVEVLTLAMKAKEKTENLRALHQKADSLSQAVLSYQMSTKKLITATSQITSNAQSAQEGTIASLIDGQTTGSPFFHSTYGNPADPGVPHYLQVKLTAPIKAFKAVLARRSGGYGYADAAKDILISASKDGQTFQDITHYYTSWNPDVVETKTTDLILLRDEYQYVRFTILKTQQNRCNSGQTHPFFTLSELQMYEATLDEEHSTYFDSDEKQQAYAELQELIKSQQDILNSGVATDDDIAALQAAMDNLENPQPAPLDPVPAVESQTKLVKGSWLAIGNLAGMKAPETGRDYVDYVSKRLCFSQVMTCPIGEGKINSAYLRIKQADYYTVELGSTDCAAGTPVGTLTDYVNGTNSGSFAFWMRKVIDLINSVSTEAKVVLCTPRHSEEGTDLLPYARLIREIGEYEGYPVADLTANCGGQFHSDEISADEINQRVANEVTDGLNKVLKYDAAQ
ncbi:MAG: leucine-rich repeat protein [Bacteroidaceae bacterium]|nr:leucine-rich repeat protein [Bacteroidaceae bacterium]